MSYQLIETTKHPSMANPYVGSDDGDAWVLSDFFFLFSKGPMTVAESMKAVLGQPANRGPMIYHYNLAGFYKPKANPMGPSRLPILSVGIEELVTFVDHRGFMGKLLGSPLTRTSLGIHVGMFLSAGRLNWGTIPSVPSREGAFQLLLGHAMKHLGLQGQPRRVGPGRGAFENPEVGVFVKMMK